MNALHISYAAYRGKNTDPANDYVRARRYPIPADGKFDDTVLLPNYAQTGLFKPGIPYQITVIAGVRS